MIDFEEWVKTQVLDADGYIAFRPELWPEHLRESIRSLQPQENNDDQTK